MENFNIMLVICVNYNNDDETASFIEQLLKQDNFYNGRIILVNNGDKINKLLADLCSNQQRIRFYQADKNLGYFGGAWWGLKQYLEEFPMPEWIIVSNTDIHFPDLNFFEKLIRYHSSQPPAVVAPDIMMQSSDGGLLVKQNPHLKYRPSRFRMLSYKLIYKFYLLGLMYETACRIKMQVGASLFNGKSMMNSRNEFERYEEIYAPMGAFIIFNRKYFDVGGTLYHGCLLFGEEISVAETVYKRRLNVLYDARLRVIHSGHGTTSMIKSKKMIKYKNESAQYCYNALFKFSNMK